jgi:iron complex outermembrane recepter protein
MSKYVHSRSLERAIKAHSLTMASAIALTVAFAAGAHGQDGAAKRVAAQAPVNEIVITGSHIRRDGFNSPVPVTVMDQQFMQQMGIVNISDVVAQLPQNSNFTSPANVGLGNFNVGATLANLRGLNPFFGTRTLTLLNGHRFVPSTNGGAVDLNMIPTVMVGRTETVTGGASAAYGTDAIAGVVNIILDNTFTGMKTQVDYGQTFLGDGKDYHVSGEGGFNFAGDRGHVVVGGEFQHSGGIGFCAEVRTWCASSYGLFTNNNYIAEGTPHYIIGPDARTNLQPVNGLIHNGAMALFPGFYVGVPLPASLQNMQFTADGTGLMPYIAGNYVGTSPFAPQQGGDGASSYANTTVRPPIERYSALTRTDYDFTDSLRGHLELSYGQSTTTNRQGEFGGPSDSFIGVDNPYLPASVVTELTNAGLPGFLYSRDIADFVRQINHSKNRTWRAEFGLEGDITDSWTWDAYYQHGRNHLTQRLQNTPNGIRRSRALDVVIDPATGDPACRSITSLNPGGPDPAAVGCAPLNAFGPIDPNSPGVAYVYNLLGEDFYYNQNVIAGNVHGDVFEGWGAGAIKGAAGVEYRSDSVNDTHLDDGFPQSEFIISWGNDWKGSQTIAEGYAELDIPVLKDLPVAKFVDVDLAIRQTRNKTSDKLNGAPPNTTNFTTWKASVIYDIVDGFRIRAAQSRDVRAPSMRELFATQLATTGFFASVFPSPWTGGLDPATVRGGGSPDLIPEKADTTTIGAVIQPTFADGLSFSVDWYQIKLKNAITGIGTGEMATDCKNLGIFCDRLTFAPGAGPGEVADNLVDITFVDNGEVNLASYVTRGFDFEFDYTLGLDKLGLDTNGSLSLRTLASYLYTLDITPPGAIMPQHRAGISGPTAAFGSYNTSPHWLGNATMTYANMPFTAALQARYIGGGKFGNLDTYVGPEDPGYNIASPLSINTNRVSSRIYFNLSMSYDIKVGSQDHAVTLFGVINNLFAKDPPIAPGGNGYPTNPVYFDTYGPSFRMGVRMRY